MPSFATPGSNKRKWNAYIQGTVQRLDSDQSKLFRQHRQMAIGRKRVSRKQSNKFMKALNAHFPGVSDTFFRVKMDDSSKSVKRVKTNQNGKYQGSVDIQVEDALADAKSIQYEWSDPSIRSLNKGRIQLHQHHGISVVTDIDDTIKNTGTMNHKKHHDLRFRNPYEAIPGMPEYFRYLHAYDPKNPTSFHYVSGSPIEFLPSLQDFIENKAKFPMGSYHLQHHAVETGQHKEHEVGQITTRLPQRQFIYFGDSTYKDAEVYAKKYKENPDQTLCIFIRMVNDMDNVKEQVFLNSVERFEDIFKGIPTSKWRLFTSGDELPSIDSILKGDCRDEQSWKISK